MEDIALMRSTHCARNMRNDAKRLRRRESSNSVQALCEVFPFQQFHRNEWLVTLNAIVKYLNYVWAAKGRCSLRFSQEALKGSGLPRYRKINELYRDGRTQNELLGLPNGTKSTLA